MKIRIRIETEFGWGERRSHAIDMVERHSIDASEEDLGLRLGSIPISSCSVA